MNKDVIMIIERIVWQQLKRYQNDEYCRLSKYNDFRNYLKMDGFLFNYRLPGRQNGLIWNRKKNRCRNEKYRKTDGRLPKNY